MTIFVKSQRNNMMFFVKSQRNSYMKISSTGESQGQVHFTCEAFSQKMTIIVQLSALWV